MSEVIAGLDGSVLIVEDDSGMRSATRRAIGRAGLRVHTAADGDEAARMLAEHNDIKLVLLDIILPGRRGTELKAEFEKRYPDTQFVLVSGYDTESLEAVGVSADHLKVLHKDPRHLIESIKDLMKV
jgi:DNA-binding NtrC family response regulator